MQADKKTSKHTVHVVKFDVFAAGFHETW
jgi:hypothetical protein